MESDSSTERESIRQEKRRSRDDYNGEDLERQATVQSKTGSEARQRISRIQSITTSRKKTFTHPLAHVKTTEADIVTFDGEDDPYRPVNWPFRKKAITTLLYGLTTMGSTLASAIYAGASMQLAGEYGVADVKASLGTSLFMLGLGLGPMVWGPLSEVYGRKSVVLVPYFISACFYFAVGASQDLSSILICRFFAGLFGSAPVTNTGGVLGDIWRPEQRGTALVFYAFAVVGGPTIGPIISGAIVQSYLRWRWTSYITGIYAIVLLALDVIILEETYPPALLVVKARRLRHDTGNWSLHAKHEEWDVSFKQMVIKFGVRPFQLLMTPICLLVALYCSFVYGIVYLMLAAVPIQFSEHRGWGPVTSELPFIGILLGAIMGGLGNIYNNTFYIKKFKANNNTPVPEARLPPMCIGSFFFTGGMFIFGWCSYTSVFWLAPVIGLVCLGLGFFLIFQSGLNYLIDCFQTYAASAVAANTFLRSIMAAAFPLVAPFMFHNLGIPVASSILGAIGVLMIPIPFLFYIFGPTIRKRGRYTASLA